MRTNWIAAAVLTVLPICHAADVSKLLYPVSARRGGVQGTVRFNVLVRLNGSIGKMITVSGPAVRDWRYEPTLLNGRPCYVLTAIGVNFTLSRRVRRSREEAA
jgi:hypothetical protein